MIPEPSVATFDTPAYRKYDDLVNKERAKSPDNLTQSIMQLGFTIDQKLSSIIDKLDVILKDEFNPDNVTCSIDDQEVDCNTWEETNYGN